MDLITMYLHSDKIQQKVTSAVQEAKRGTNRANRVCMGDQPPMVPAFGDVWIDTGSGGAQYYDGTRFIPIMSNTAMVQVPSAMDTLTAMETVNRNRRIYGASPIEQIASIINEAAAMAPPPPTHIHHIDVRGIPLRMPIDEHLIRDSIWGQVGSRRSRSLRGQSI